MKKKSEIVRRLKKDYAYSLNQLHKNFEIHPQTIRAYSNDKDNPLELLSTKPTLVWSETLRNYLKNQIEAKQEKLLELEFYCLSCKKKQMPLNNLIAETNINDSQYTRKAVCPVCYSIMNKYCSSKGLTKVLPLYKSISLEELYILQHSKSPQKTHKKKKLKGEQKDSEVSEFDLFGVKVNAK